MKLKELLNITTVDTIVKLEGIRERKKSDMKTINCKNEYGRIDLKEWNNIENLYGENKVLHQFILDSMLIVLINL